MPEEYRKLLFTDDELKQAIVEFCQSNGMILPQDEIIAVEMTGLPHNPVRLRYSTTTQRGATEVSLSRDQLGAALIIYCRQRRIPVPRSAEKNVKINGSEVALLVHVPT